MNGFRNTRPFAGWAARLMALLLIVLVAGETTDLLPCGDESGSVTATSGSENNPGSHDAPDGAALDCLCHVSFARTDALPPVTVRAGVGTVIHESDGVSPADMAVAPPAPVPLG